MRAVSHCIVLAFFVAAAAAGSSAEKVPLNKLIVTYSIFPDPFHWFSFFPMPRTIQEAQDDSFASAGQGIHPNTTLWCRKEDYRVCVLFDAKGSVGGLQVSAAVEELQSSGAPMKLFEDSQWFRNKVLGVDVYSTVAYFVNPDILASGGRTLTDSVNTAEGIYIREGPSTTLDVPVALTPETQSSVKGFTRQGCFRGMGRHYFYGVKPDMKCENIRPYFLLFGEQTDILHGYGISMYGKISTGRGWFEVNPPEYARRIIAPDAPPCMNEWVTKYNLYTMHVYFIDSPSKQRC